MAIRTQVFPWNPKYDADKPFVEVDGQRWNTIKSDPDATYETKPNRWNDGTGEVVCMATHHVGLVVETRERNWSDDSDFYAIVWNPETKSLDHYDYATTRFGGTDNNTAQADLDPKYYADLRDYYINLENAAIRREWKQQWREDLMAAVEPRKGARLRVVRGRKVPVGFEGVCIWAGQGSFGPRFGIKSDEGDVQFVDGRNVEVAVDPDDLPAESSYWLTDEEVDAQAAARVDAGFGRVRWLKQGEAPGLVVVA